MTYTTLFLDLDNTLLDFNRSENAAIRFVLAANGFPSGEKEAALYHAINKQYWERFERGEIKKEEIFTGRFETLLATLNIHTDAAEIARQYGEKLADGFFVIDGAFTLLDYLKNKGYRLYATTNGISFVQARRVAGSGLKPYFSDVFVSEDAGFQKPQKEYFAYALSHIPERDIRNILMIGDSQTSDILGGLNAGIDTCWYNPEHAPARYPSRYEVHTLAELQTIL